MPPRKPSSKVEVSSIRHTNETRKNIPPMELRDWVARDEKTPSVKRYPRDPSLDPQLVWKGKDEQDGEDLAVPIVPIYIQEKIHPQAIIETVREAAQRDEPQQLDLFSDFNGIPFSDLVEFYQHDQHWTNRMILGDSKLVMNSLAEKEGLKGKVQMIYIDPPYGIKFGSNWQTSTKRRNPIDGREEDLVRQPEQIRAFRDTWEKGIHSYLTYLRDRLSISHELLTQQGSIFVQIGIENLHLVRNILDEVFGSTNFISVITFSTTSGFASNVLPRGGDYLIWYAKDTSQIIYNSLLESTDRDTSSGYRWVQFADGFSKGLSVRELNGEIEVSKDAHIYKPDNILSQGAASKDQTFVHRGKSYSPGANSHWKAKFPDGMRRLARGGRIHVAKNSIQYVRFADDYQWKTRNNIWTDTLTGQFTDEKIYVVQTNTKIVERCILMTTKPGDLVLDPTCGSGTTACVAEQWGRRWITIDTSRVALTLARARLMSAKFDYYLLADSQEGWNKTRDIIKGIINPENPPTTFTNDISHDFVYEMVPHITLRDIANNEEIDTIYDAYETKLAPMREQINTLTGVGTEEWQLPRAPAADWNAEARQLLDQYWTLRRDRQAKIDASIRRNAAYELLYDKPYKDPRKVRVTGPFTVESLSPHRVIDPETAETMARSEPTSVSSYEQMIIENLRKAEVQNTRKGERLIFNTLEPYAGTWIHAAGTYTDVSGMDRRVAISIGSEYGTVTADQIKEAVKETRRALDFDVLLVCGFAFDAHANEEEQRYNKDINFTVQLVRMNADLMMGDVLKKTNAANLFMILGEPDILIEPHAGDQVVVELRGLDIYDPTTGQIRSSGRDEPLYEVACWFIDTNYNEESFRVRHAYFTGEDNVYDQLKRALRAEIDEEAWSMLYSNRSIPFPRPESGKIAVKVINHYGDEVLKVYEVSKIS